MCRANMTFLMGMAVFCLGVSAELYLANINIADAAPKIDKNGNILEWLILGPIRNTGDGAVAIKIDYIKEAGKGSAGDLRPKAGQKITIGPKKEELTWERVNFQELKEAGDIAEAVGGTNLDRKAWGGAVENACAYLSAYLLYKKGGSVEYFLGSDGTVKVWLNGKEIWFNEAKRVWGADQDKYSGSVKPNSWNAYMVQICNTTGSWSLSIRDLTGIDDLATDPIVLSVESLGKLATTWGLAKKKYYKY